MLDGWIWVDFLDGTQPGKLTFCYGKSPFLMGKLTISMAIFNSYVKLLEGTRPGKHTITLLRVIPTMTSIRFVTGKSSGILSDISSGILSGISSGKHSGILSGISSSILSGMSSGISSGILSGR